MRTSLRFTPLLLAVLGAVTVPHFGSRLSAAEVLTQVDLFPSDRVLQVQIELPAADWDKLRHQSRSLFEVLHEKRRIAPIPSPYSYVGATVTIDGHPLSAVGVRKKGFIGSLSTKRPSLKIKLNHEDAQADIDGLTNLTFNNNKQDPSQLNQMLGYALFRAAGLPAPRCALASVTVNGENLGVYSHVESMRRPLFARELGTDQGVLYEGTVTDFYPGWAGSFEHKFGDASLGRERIENLIRTLDDCDATNAEEKLGELIDLDAFYQFWALESLLGSWDGYAGNRNNYFVYLHPDSGKFHFLPWGIDAVFQKHSKIAYDPEAPLSVKTTGRIAHTLYQSEAGAQRYRDSLRQMLESVWKEEHLLSEIDRLEQLMQPLLIARQGKYQEELQQTREFIRTRRGELLAEIADGMPAWTRKPDPLPAIPAALAAQYAADSLWNLAKDGNVSALRAKLAEGTDVNARTPDGTTALSMAALGGQAAAVRLLLESGADVDAQNNDGNSALHSCAFFCRLPEAKLLLQAGAKVNVRNDEGDTPLDVAQAEWTEESTKLVEFVAGFLQISIDADEVKSSRPLVAALFREHGGKSGAAMPQRPARDIWEASKKGNLTQLKKFLAAEDADPNALDTQGISPLAWAAMAGQAEAAKLLVEAGAEVNQRNQDGSVPLHGAAFLGRQEVVEQLLQLGADTTLKNNRGDTPLDAVAADWNPQVQGITEFVARFLKLKIDIESIKQARPQIAELLRSHEAASKN